MKSLASFLIVLFFCTTTSIISAQTSQHRDIGAVAVAGSAANSGTSGFTITASGSDIWGTADEFHYVYVSLTGDIEMVTRVTGVQFTDGWAKAGLMARETLDASSRNVMVFLTPQNLSGFQWRAVTGGSTSYYDGGSAGSPYWLKLVRSGNTFSGYRSADGVNWTLIGSTTIALPSTLYIGLAVTSHHDGTLCTANFDNVTQSSGGGGGGGVGPVPAAPTNLAAGPSRTNEIFLTWTDNATNETSYRVERSTDGVDFQPAATVSANG